MKYLICIAIFFPIYLAGFSTPVKKNLIWQSFPLPPGFDGKKILVDEDQYLWVGGINAIQRFDGHFWDIFELNSQNQGEVTNLFQLENGEIWTGTSRGEMFKWNGQAFLNPYPNHQLPKVPVKKILIDGEGRYWIATYGRGVFLISGDEIFNFNKSKGLPSNYTYDLSLTNDQRVWVATDQGIGICTWSQNECLVESLTKADGLPDEIITSIYHNPNNEVWIGTYDKGIYRRKTGGDHWEAAFPQNSEPIEVVKTGSQDLAFFTSTGSLFIFESFRELASISIPARVRDFFLHTDGRVWVLADDNMIYQAPLYAQQFEIGGLVPQAITGTQEEMWIGTVEGLYKYSAEKKALTHYPSPTSINIASLFLDSWGRLWIGTLGQGLWRYDGNTDQWELVRLEEFQARIPILSILQKGHEVWIGTFGGVFVCNLDANGRIIDENHVHETNELGLNYVYQLTSHSSGEVWISIDGHGLAHTDEGAVRHLDIHDHSSIYSHTNLSNDELLFLTDQGKVIHRSQGNLDTLLARDHSLPLALTNVDTAKALAVFEDNMSVIYPHDKQVLPLLSGLDQVTYGKHLNVFCHTPADHLWLGIPGRLICIQKQSIRPYKPIPVLLKKLSINLEEVSPSQRSFDHDQNHLTINYAGLWWDQPNQIKYQHRLVGYDLDWITSRDLQAIYPRLSPGQYSFEVRVSPNDDFLQGVALKIPITIKKPFWDTAWFISLIILAFMVSMLTWARFREQKIHRKQAMENFLTKNQLDTLRSQINPHFLFNAFSTLIDIVEESKPKAISYINRLSDLFRNMLAFRNLTFISLDEELEILDNYYRLQKERYGNSFHLRLTISNEHRRCKIPPLILQILVENVLKHNKVSRDYPLTVHIYSESDTLVIKNKIQRRAVPGSSTQIGLQNIRERYRLLTQKEVEISDSGQYFVVQLPLIF